MVIGGAAIVAVVIAAILFADSTGLASAGVRAIWPAPVPKALTVSQIVAKDQPAVVTVKATLFRTGVSEGSGFLFDRMGDVVTNEHVVRHATQMSIIDSNGLVHPATLIGVNPSLDLAELRVADLANQVPLKGAKGKPVVGSDILVIGNPYGQLPNTVTKGIISGLGRDETVAGTHYFNLLQIDAVVNPGNSGGPVVDAAGQVIGVLTLGSAVSRFGFVIPITSVTEPATAWATANSPVTVGAPLVAATANTLVLAATAIPTGFITAFSQQWGADPMAWSVQYHRPPDYLVNGQYITSSALVRSSESRAVDAYNYYPVAAMNQGYQNLGLSAGPLADDMWTGVKRDGDTDHFEIVWRDRNVVALIQVDAVPGEANLGVAYNLAAQQEALINADLRAAGYL